MTQENQTRAILAQLEASGGRALSHPGELAELLDLATTPERTKALDDASFIAKFLVRTMGIMRRIGPGGNGYEKLAQEFTANIQNVRGLLRALVENSPDATRRHFIETFLDVTPSALDNLLSLCNDLMRYKNWRMDEERGNRTA